MIEITEIPLLHRSDLRISGINDPRILRVPVKENNETFVLVSHPRIWKPSQLDESVGVEDGIMAVRSSVASALYAATDSLPENFGLVFVEGYRPFDYQLKLFQQEVQKQRVKLSVEVPDAVLEASARKFVSDPRLFSPHVTGGAVDVSLVEIFRNRDGVKRRPSNMGNIAFAHDATALTEAPGLSLLQDANRKLLVQVMESVGFTNYPFEFWHFSVGDKLDAFVKNTSAMFGEIRAPRVI